MTLKEAPVRKRSPSASGSRNPSLAGSQVEPAPGEGHVHPSTSPPEPARPGATSKPAPRQPGAPTPQVATTADTVAPPSDRFGAHSGAAANLQAVTGGTEAGRKPQPGQLLLDAFDPALPPSQVEPLGSLRAAVHLVRLMDHMEANGTAHDQVVQHAARLLLSFSNPATIHGVLHELEQAPVYNVYPLELEMALLDHAPRLFPNTSRGNVVANKEELAGSPRTKAGHDCRLHLPRTMKLTAFALLTPGQPGYEFEPVRPGIFRLLVDTPGEWSFAVRAQQGLDILIDTFTVVVRDAGVVEDVTSPRPGARRRLGFSMPSSTDDDAE